MVLWCNLLACPLLLAATVYAWRAGRSWAWRLLAIAVALMFARRALGFLTASGSLGVDWRRTEAAMLVLISAALALSLGFIAREQRP